MDHLWAPWRREFVQSAGKKTDAGCIFCTLPAETGPEADRRNLIVARSASSFAILNRYPYNNGHLMVVPRRHTGEYAALEAPELADLQRLLQIGLRVLEEAYHPGGFNLGMNLGHDGGAGIEGHLHWHLVPRWRGDTNFMPIVGATKVINELLPQTWDALQPLFQRRLAG
jgi:ATP adenylyltransferase